MQQYKALTTKMALNLMSPHTWAASILPAVFGGVFCYAKGFNLPAWQFALLILACILMQSSVNVLNDYLDFVKGTDSTEDNLERSDAVLLYENINPKSALILSILLLVAAVIIGAILIIVISCLIPLWIGIIGALAIVFYSAGKTPISYLPIGEIISGFVMGGLIPLGCVAVTTKSWHPEALLYSIPFIISIGLIMMSNNGCDIEKDIKAGRKTLPVVLGRKKTKALYKALVALWMAALVIFSFMLAKTYAFICVILLLIFARKPVMGLLSLPLNQEHRIQQMKTIIAANYTANISYIICLAIYAIAKLFS